MAITDSLLSNNEANRALTNLKNRYPGGRKIDKVNC